MVLGAMRRFEDAGLPPIFSPHSFRVQVVTDLRSQDVRLTTCSSLSRFPCEGGVSFFGDDRLRGF